MNWTTGCKSRIMSFKKSSDVCKNHGDNENCQALNDFSQKSFLTSIKKSQDLEIGIFDHMEAMASKSRHLGQAISSVKKVDLESREKLKESKTKRILSDALTDSPIPPSKLRLSSSSPVHEEMFPCVSEKYQREICAELTSGKVLQSVKHSEYFKKTNECVSLRGDCKHYQSKQTQTYKVSTVDIGVQTEDD